MKATKQYPQTRERVDQGAIDAILDRIVEGSIPNEQEYVSPDDLANPTIRKPRFRDRIFWLNSRLITQTDYGKRFEQVNSNNAEDVLFECVYSVFLITAQRKESEVGRRTRELQGDHYR